MDIKRVHDIIQNAIYGENGEIPYEIAEMCDIYLMRDVEDPMAPRSR